MPSSRAGKIVRCPECKKIIQLDRVSKSEHHSGKPIPMSAVIVRSKEEVEVEPETTPLPSIDSTSGNIPPIDLPAVQVQTSDSKAERPRLMVPKKIEPPSVRRRKSQDKKSSSKPAKSPRLPTVRLDSDTRTISESGIPLVTDNLDSRAGLQRRVSSANADRALLSRFFAICLCLVAAINLVPAIYFGIQWSRTFETTALPRWIYLQAFIAALHVIYAVYLVQIQDWSALKAVAIAMLTVAFAFGLISTGLIAGGGQGVIAQFLEIPHVLTSQASIWCVAMLCLSTLMCYVGGRVAVNWQRTEQLLREIIA